MPLTPGQGRPGRSNACEQTFRGLSSTLDPESRGGAPLANAAGRVGSSELFGSPLTRSKGRGPDALAGRFGVNQWRRGGAFSLICRPRADGRDVEQARTDEGRAAMARTAGRRAARYCPCRRRLWEQAREEVGCWDPRRAVVAASDEIVCKEKEEPSAAALVLGEVIWDAERPRDEPPGQPRPSIA